MCKHPTSQFCGLDSAKAIDEIIAYRSLVCILEFFTCNFSLMEPPPPPEWSPNKLSTNLYKLSHSLYQMSKGKCCKKPLSKPACPSGPWKIYSELLKFLLQWCSSFLRWASTTSKIHADPCTSVLILLLKVNHLWNWEFSQVLHDGCGSCFQLYTYKLSPLGFMLNILFI